MGTICLMSFIIHYISIQNIIIPTNYHHLYFCHHVDWFNGCLVKRILSWIEYVFDRLKNRSFFQSASLLGYCVFPLNIVSFLTCIIGGWIPPFIKLILVILSLIWSTKCTYLLWLFLAAMGFIGEMVP